MIGGDVLLAPPGPAPARWWNRTLPDRPARDPARAIRRTTPSWSHSYGTVAVGFTMRDHKPPVDDVILVGSSGVGVEHAEDLNIDPSHVCVARGSEDTMIKHVASTGPAFGLDPVDNDFGPDTSRPAIPNIRPLHEPDQRVHRLHRRCRQPVRDARDRLLLPLRVTRRHQSPAVGDVRPALRAYAARRAVPAG
ncbi:alpha/beta hydrolase [Kitasatospora sp. NPDC059648]|uniref:alpha/beta hydrolase n=1 Tax=Kitasatospora sp. NPDC059648 TaxID=3346894 RepID=UPI00367BA360